MDEIKLYKIKKIGNSIVYNFSVNGDISKYFSGKEFKISYPESIEVVPDSIASIPFVCSVLPIIWITNASLVISRLDFAFYKSIFDFKKGYQEMFPETVFGGKIIVKSVEKNYYANTDKSAMFYSGGLDSMQTFISHLKEKPILLAIWGSDIEYNNIEGWNLVYTGVKETAKKFCLNSAVIHSSFREFDNEGLLNKFFSNQLKDDWWHGVKHGISLLGHVAPYAWIHQINNMYIAATNCYADGKVRCASNPIIDNYVRFASCRVVHDGFEYNRQEKVHNLVKFCNEKHDYVHLHVCWQSQSGTNCCCCEKCYRTIAELIVEGENPENYGFEITKKSMKQMRTFIIDNKAKYSQNLKNHWKYTSQIAKQNKKNIKKNKYYKEIKWIINSDFNHPESLCLPITTILYRKMYSMLYRLRCLLKSVRLI